MTQKSHLLPQDIINFIIDMSAMHKITLYNRDLKQIIESLASKYDLPDDLVSYTKTTYQPPHYLEDQPLGQTTSIHVSCHDIWDEQISSKYIHHYYRYRVVMQLMQQLPGYPRPAYFDLKADIINLLTQINEQKEKNNAITKTDDQTQS